MKKVRYAIGALGVAPTLGLMMPTANAVAAVTHSPGKASKTVSLEHSKVPRIDTCGHGHSKHGNKGSFEGIVYYSSGKCMHETEGILGKRQAGLSMRTRLYSANGTKNYSHFVGGSEIGSATYFFDVVNRVDTMACEALTSQGPNHTVKYGPVCETI
jgi:hypothetical protein